MRPMFIPTAQAAGVIEDAPSFAQILLNAYYFLLQIAGIIGILGIVLVGALYIFAAGDKRKIRTAKMITGAVFVGVLLLFGSWIILKTIAGLFG
jgi:hypothetical protein